MGWMEIVAAAINYIEDHLTDDLNVEVVARHVHMSAFCFQRGFSMLCGFTPGEYIRCRRLALAGKEVAAGDEKIIDIALKYGYDSPDSFTRAFTRFHGTTPMQVRKENTLIKSFAPLKIRFSLEGGYLMDYRIEKKESFTVLAKCRVFPYEGAKDAVPKFWEAHHRDGFNPVVLGTYGICRDKPMTMETFEYMIADPCSPGTKAPEGFEVHTIPAFTWVVFPFRGAMPEALQNVNERIFSEWLPALKEYEFAAGYNVEYYDDPRNYAKGTLDENYYCEIWLPIRKMV